MWRILFAGSLLVTSAVSAETVNFEDTKLGSLPANWLGAPTGSGTARWSVGKDDSAPGKSSVLKQSGAPNEGIAAIDLVSRKVLGEVNLSHPQGFCLEEGGDRLFVCSPQASQISIMDRKKLTAAGAWKLAEVQGNYPVAYDAATHRLFVGCRRPAKLVVFNTDNGEVIATVDTGKGTDDLSFDPVNKRIYVACGEGVISVVQQDDPNHYRNIATVKTAPGARNGLFIPETGQFCVTVPQHDSEPATLLVFKTKSSHP